MLQMLPPRTPRSTSSPFKRIFTSGTMKQGRSLGRQQIACFAAVLATLSIVATAQSADESKKQQVTLYGEARPYVDESPAQLQKAVHELKGLELASNQDPLPEMLRKVADKADALLRATPDLISDESVSEVQWTVDKGIVPGCTGGGCVDPMRSNEREEKFNYIILAHRGNDNRLHLEEYRTTANDKPVEGAGAPYFQGFVASWLIFSSPNQVESRFRYLGRQKIKGQATFVVAFAQVPGSVEMPGTIMTSHGAIPMLLQGIAWVDQSNFRIVRLRTDLLAPQLSMGFKVQTSDIVFGPVRISGADLDLWLPVTVNAEMEAEGQQLRERHLYSNYRLYQAKSRIVAAPTN